MTCSKNSVTKTNATVTANGSEGNVMPAIQLPASIRDEYNITHLHKSFLFAKDRFEQGFLDKAKETVMAAAKTMATTTDMPEETTALDVIEEQEEDIIDAALLPEPSNVRTAGASGGNNLFIYGGLALATWLLFRN